MSSNDTHPMLRSRRPLIITRPGERLAGDAKNSIEFGSDAIWVDGVGRIGKTFGVRQLIQTDAWRPFPMYIAEFTYTKPSKPGEGYFASSLLLQQGQRVSSSGASNVTLMRAIRMLKEEGYRQGAEMIGVALNEANRFTAEEYEHLMSIANEFEKQDRIFFFLINQTDSGKFGHSQIDKRPPRHIHGRFFTSSHRYTGLLWNIPEDDRAIQSVSDVALAFHEYDNELFWPEGSDVSFTNYFAPQAYAAGWRLGAQIDLIHSVINALRAENGLPDATEWPMQSFERFVYFVLVRVAYENANFSELTGRQIREGLQRAGYLEIEPGYRGALA
ncbi:hypothetical protein [Xanthomonas graminis]|uniref:hypothetical protein n=1 Tax=Xanthomonas graminis TaxID=3390026 RepID=UPI001F384512|nr:hypothetical protein [Xanthomonas translucens]UKE71462.1 hypothetical protein KFS85_10015 [Xanthomonas translucens pv. phleipratensis]